MINSMTGYGAGRTKKGALELEVTLRSLNGRFLELRVHMPREYQSFEPAIRGLVSERLKRGTVDLFVSRRLSGGGAVEPQIDVDSAQAWLKAYQNLSKKLKLKGEIDLQRLATLPEIMSWRAPGLNQGEEKLLMKAVDEAIDACLEQRSREGAAIGEQLKELLSNLEKKVRAMKVSAETQRDEMAKKLKTRLESSPISEKIESSRLMQELSFYIDRADVNEELQRLIEHLRACVNHMSDPDLKGKKLDFYSQELLREVNTIGSKSASAQLTELVVDAKTLVEQIKEQVQNIA